MATYEGTPLRPGRTQTPIQAKRPSARSLATSAGRGGYRATGGISIPEERKPPTPSATGTQALSEFSPRVPEQPNALGQAALGVGTKIAGDYLGKAAGNFFSPRAPIAGPGRAGTDYGVSIPSFSGFSGAPAGAAESFDFPVLSDQTGRMVGAGPSLTFSPVGEAVSAGADVGSAAFDPSSLYGADEFADVAMEGYEGLEGATGGVPWVGPAIRLAQGDVRGAAGNLAGAMIGNAILPGVGGAVGGFLGGLVGGRVICTYFAMRGELSRELLKADLAYTEHLSPITVRGYHAWAVPYVRLMRHSKLARDVMRPIATARAEEIAFRMGVRTEGNLIGRAIDTVGQLFCFTLGLVVKATDWTILYKEQTS